MDREKTLDVIRQKMQEYSPVGGAVMDAGIGAVEAVGDAIEGPAEALPQAIIDMIPPEARKAIVDLLTGPDTADRKINMVLQALPPESENTEGESEQGERRWEPPEMPDYSPREDPVVRTR